MILFGRHLNTLIKLGLYEQVGIQSGEVNMQFEYCHYPLLGPFIRVTWDSVEYDASSIVGHLVYCNDRD